MSDLIDRQAAIDEFEKELSAKYNRREFAIGFVGIKRILEKLPSAQPEIIRCKDCAIRYDSCPMVVRVGGYISFFTEDNDFCSRGRRRE